MDVRQDASTREQVRNDIVAAAARLLSEQGAAAVTTRAVAQAAGVQAPTIYRLFGDKDGLIDAVAEHVMATYVATKQALAGADEAAGDPVADLRSAWRMHVEFGLANPELYALLGPRARGRSTQAASPATIAGIQVLRARVRRLAAAGRLRVQEHRATMMVHAAGNGSVLALLSTLPEQRDLGLADAMLEAVLGAILTTAPVTPDTRTNAIAMTFATVLPDLPGLSDAERALMSEWLDRSVSSPPNH